MLVPLIKLAKTGAVLVAMSNACPAMPVPKVVVSPLEIPMRQDFNRTTQELRQIAGNVYTPFTGTNNALGGLMTGSVRANVNVEFDGGPVAADQNKGKEEQACIWPSVISVDVTLEPVLYINRDLPAGSCMHDVVARHEMEHYQIDKATIFEFIPQIQQAVTGAAMRIGVQGPLPFDKTRALGDPIGNDIRDVVRSLVTRLNETRRQRNATHDNPQEQVRMLQACNQSGQGATPADQALQNLYFNPSVPMAPVQK